MGMISFFLEDIFSNSPSRCNFFSDFFLSSDSFTVNSFSLFSRSFSSIPESSLVSEIISFDLLVQVS